MKEKWSTRFAIARLFVEFELVLVLLDHVLVRLLEVLRQNLKIGIFVNLARFKIILKLVFLRRTFIDCRNLA